MAQFRCVTASLHIESGWYEGIPEEARLCQMCNDGVENELHALLECALYSDIRQTLLTMFAIKYVFFIVLLKRSKWNLT